MLQELEMAVAWLELAKAQASGDDGGRDPTNGLQVLRGRLGGMKKLPGLPKDGLHPAF